MGRDEIGAMESNLVFVSWCVLAWQVFPALWW